MLYIHFNAPDDTIFDVNYFFNSRKNKDWFNRQDVKDIIKNIDNTIAVKDEYMESPVFGGMSPDRLSGGCKAVILMLIQDRPIYATKCGNNCVNDILKIAETKDLHICLHNCMLFPKEFNAFIVDTGKMVHSRKEYMHEYYNNPRD
jgi:hypothetical protein